MKTNFDEYVAITEFIDKLQASLEDNYNVYVPNKALTFIMKRYEEFKIEMEGEK